MKTNIFRITFFLVITVFVSAGFSDMEERPLLADNEFKVITVQGRIVFKKSGDDMKRGDLYLQGTPLDFISNDSRAAIINENKGRFILSGNTRGKFKILPSSNNISTRSGALLNIIDLKNHFEGRYLVLKRMELQISSDTFPMDKDHFFYLKYEHNDEVIPKKLRSEGDFLILDKSEIFKIDGEEIDVEEKEMTLYYKGADKTIKISKFTPIFPDESELKDEVSVLLSSMNNDEISERIIEVTSFLNEFYGRPYKPNLENWLDAEFGLKEE